MPIYKVKKEFGIPSFGAEDSSIGSAANQLAQGYLDYQNQIKSQLGRMNIHGGGAVGAMENLQDWTKQQASQLQSAKAFNDIKSQLSDLTTQYQEKQQQYLRAKEDMQHRIPIIGGRGESETAMNQNLKEMTALKAQIDSLTRSAEQFSGNPYVGSSAMQMPEYRSSLETANNQALNTNYGDITDTIGRVAGGVLLGPAVGAIGAALPGLNAAVAPLVDAYTKFTGSNPVSDISNAIMSGTPVDQAIKDVVQKGTNLQVLSKMNEVMGQPTKVTRNEKGELQYEWAKPTTDKKDIPNITTNDIQEGAVGKIFDIPDNNVSKAESIIATRTPTPGYQFQIANYGGYPKVVEIKVGSSLSKMVKAEATDIARGLASPADIKSGKYIEKVNPNTGKIDRYKVSTVSNDEESNAVVTRMTPIVQAMKLKGVAYEEAKNQVLDSYAKGELKWTEYQKVKTILDDVYGKQIDPTTQAMIDALTKKK